MRYALIFILFPALMMIRFTLGEIYGFLEFDDITGTITNYGYKNTSSKTCKISIKSGESKILDVEMEKSSQSEIKSALTPGLAMVSRPDGWGFPNGFQFGGSVEY